MTELVIIRPDRDFPIEPATFSTNFPFLSPTSTYKLRHRGLLLLQYSTPIISVIGSLQRHDHSFRDPARSSAPGQLFTMVAGTEPFPQLRVREQARPNGNDVKVRPRRKSSGLGGEIRAGDTGVPAAATWDLVPPSPGQIKVRRLPPGCDTPQY